MNNKLIIILALIGVLVVSGCGKGIFNPPTEENTPPKEMKEESTNNITQYLAICPYHGFYVVYVEEIIHNNCYAIRNTPLTFGETVNIDQTFKHPYDEIFDENDFYKGTKKYCGMITSYGTIYCLKDNSTCLMIEEKICNIINVTKVIEELNEQ